MAPARVGSLQSSRLTDLLACAAITLLGFSFRIWMLPDVPSGLLWDEGASGLDLTPLFHSQFPIFFPGHSGHPPIFFYLAAGALKAIGWTPFSLRLPAVFLNTLALPASFILARRLFGSCVAVISCALLATSLWTVLFSRLGAVSSTLPLFLALAGYWLVVWLQGKSSWRPPVLTGICAGLAFYAYEPGWFMACVVALAWLWTYAGNPTARARRLGEGIACAAIAGSIFAPLGLYLLRHQGEATARSSELSIFNPAYGGALHAWLQSVQATLLMFSFAGEPGWDKNIAGRPLFDPVVSLLAIIGLATAVRHAGRWNYRLALTWLVALLVPMTLTAKNLPDFGRTVGIAPIVYVFPALTVAWLWQRVPRSRALIGVTYAAYVALNAWLYFGVWDGSDQRIQVYRPGVLAAAESAANRLNAGDSPARVYFGTVEPFDAVPDFVGAGFAVEHPDRAAQLVGYDARYTRVVAPSGSESYVIVPGRPAVASPSPVRFHTAFNFGSTLEVRGYDLPASSSLGQPLTLQVVWQPGQSPSSGLTFFAHLLDYEQHPTAVSFDHNGFPPEDWRGGETVSSTFPLAVPPNLMPGPYWVEFGAYDGSGNRLRETRGQDDVLFGPVVLMPIPQPSNTVTATAVGPGANFGRLAGISRVEIRTASDRTGDVVIIWEPLHTLDRDYSVFVHVLDASSKVVAQADGLPANGLWPTQYWLPGTPVTDTHHLSLAQLPAGTYSVTVGLYDSASGDRLPVSGTTPEPNSMLAGKITVP